MRSSAITQFDSYELTVFANAGVGAPEVVAVDRVGLDARLLFDALVKVGRALLARHALTADAFEGANEIHALLGPARDRVADADRIRARVFSLCAFIYVLGASRSFPACSDYEIERERISRMRNRH